MNIQEVLARIDERLDAMAAETGKRLSDRALSLQAGLSADAVRNWRRSAKAGKDAGTNAGSLRQIASTLGVSETWLIHGSESPQSAPAMDPNLLDEDGQRLLQDYFQFLLQRQGRSSDGNPP